MRFFAPLAKPRLTLPKLASLCFLALTAAPAPGQTPPQQEASQATTLAVSTETAGATITIDGQQYTKSPAVVNVAPGPHSVKVEAKGHVAHQATVNLKEGDSHLHAVSLQPAVLGDAVNTTTASSALPSGVYGGLQALYVLHPGNTGHTLEENCRGTSATSCDASSSQGAGITGYFGYMIQQVGLELMLSGTADQTKPSATFDGESGSEINPLLANPARTEEFRFVRAGGALALRARGVVPLGPVPLSGALGAGLAYRYVVMDRRTESADGTLSGEVGDEGTTYSSPLLSMELAGHWKIGASTALTFGLQSWLETAEDDVKSEGRGTVLLKGSGGAVAPQATPPYDMVSGVQWAVAPFLGGQFGP